MTTPPRLAAGGRAGAPQRERITPCPYLLAGEGAWRLAVASRAHRCTAVSPPTPLGADKQRSVCLTAGHHECPTYRAAWQALAALGPALASDAPARRLIVPRSAPLVLERAGPALVATALGRSRILTQVGLVVLMAVALGAVAIARLTAGPSVSSVSSPSPSPVAATPSETPARSATPSPSPPGSPSLSAAPATTIPSSRPSPTVAPERTYTVRRGDTLSAIGARLGIDWRQIAALNGLESPYIIRPGQVLKLP